MPKKVTLIASTQSHVEGINTSEELLVYIARVSNPENQMNTATGANLLRYCIKQQHWSVFEQVDITLELKTTRAIGAQLLRHRSFTFQEFSQRYSRVTERTYPQMRNVSINGNRQSSSEPVCAGIQHVADQAITRAYEAYDELIEAGVAPETVRGVLPSSAPTTIYMKGNLRSWITYLMVRLEFHTQLEHRELAEEIWSVIKSQFPEGSEALRVTNEVFTREV